MEGVSEPEQIPHRARVVRVDRDPFPTLGTWIDRIQLDRDFAFKVPTIVPSFSITS